MFDLDNTLSLATVVYGAILLLAVALIGHGIGSALIPFFAIIALAFCYFQMTATIMGVSTGYLTALFWLAFGSSSIATLGLLWQLIIR